MKTNQVSTRMAAAVLLASLSVVLAGCHRKSPQIESDSPAGLQREGSVVIVPQKSPLRSRLVLGTAKSEPVRRTLTAPATIEPDPQRIVRVYPPVAGRVSRLHVQLGSIVTKGQVLATLHSPDFTQAQSEYLKARSALHMARRQLERQQDLLHHKIAAARDVEQAQSDFESAQSTLDSASARLCAYGLDPAKEPLGQPLTLVAPMAGRIVEMVAALGEFRNDSTTSLMTIADLSAVWISASAQEKDLRFIVKGQEARAVLPAYPGETFTGKVETIGDVLDPDTRVVKVRIVVSNPTGRLKPGMYATVEIVDFPDTVVTVPTTAVVQAGGTTVVYEQTQPWRFEPREVTLGSRHGDRTVIQKGLSGGETILAKEGVLFQQ